MPLGLRLIKECAEYHIDWHSLHYVDLLSILYSIRIDNARRFLKEQQQKAMHERGISEISKATEEDFDRL